MAKWIADILLIGVIAFVAYCISIAVERKHISNMILTVGFLIGLQVTMQDLGPVIERMNNRFDSIQDTADRIANLGNGSWEMPMKGEITQLYKGEAHHGIDIGAKEGTSVKATKEGDVSYIGWHDIYGNMVIIDHGRGIQSVYGHLKGLSVRVGWPVLAGREIGSCGNTGRSTGPHLHFEIRKNGTTVDPLSYLK